MIWVTRAQPSDVVGDVGRRDGTDLGPPGRRQRGRVPVQIPSVRLKGVGGQPALDSQVVEVAADRGVD